MKFNRLTVIEKDLTKAYRYPSDCHYLCRCDCGRIAFIKRTALISGRTKSCGCIKAEII